MEIILAGIAGFLFGTFLLMYLKRKYRRLREEKEAKLLRCPKTGLRDVNPEGNSHCTECAKQDLGAVPNEKDFLRPAKYIGSPGYFKRLFYLTKAAFAIPEPPPTKKELADQRRESARKAVAFVARQDRC
jgi:hypothetical protein